MRHFYDYFYFNLGLCFLLFCSFFSVARIIFLSHDDFEIVTVIAVFESQEVMDCLISLT